MNRYEELLSSYLEGSLDEAGRAELVELVMGDPERLRELVDLVREDRILSSEIGEPLGREFTRRVTAELDRDKTRFVKAVMEELRGSKAGGRPVPRARRPLGLRKNPGPGWILWAAAAAGAFVVLGLLLFHSGNGSEEPRASQAKSAVRNRTSPPESTPEGVPATPKPPEASPFAPDAPPPSSEEKRTPKGPAPKGPAPKDAPGRTSPVEPPVRPAPPPSPVPAPQAPEPKPVEKPTVAEVATLERLEGAVLAGGYAAQLGQALVAGFDLQTRDDRSSAVVRYPDGTRIILTGASRLRDQASGAGRRIQVEGAIFGTIAPQPKDRPMIFATAHGKAKVLGTTLRLLVDPDPKKGTRLDVDEGKVEFENLSGKTVLVESGHYAVAAQGVLLTSRLARVTFGLAALYTFKEGRGAMVHDVSRAGAPIDLKIENEKATRWSSRGLFLAAPTLVASPGAAIRIIQACKETNEVTLEVWARPAILKPEVPDARLLTLSADPFNQDFMLGQEAAEGPQRSYFARLRTTQTNSVGKPILASREGRADLKLVHLVYTRSAKGVAVLYLDGVEESRAASGGALAAWDEGYRLGLGNEFTNNRPWLGEYHLAAVYSRALSAEDVRQNHRAGTE